MSSLGVWAGWDGDNRYIMYKADMHIVIGWVLPISSQVQITIQRRARPDILVQTGCWCVLTGWWWGNDPGLYGHWAARHFSWLLTWEQAPATGGQLSTIWLGRKGRTQLLPQRQWTLGWCSSHKASWHGIHHEPPSRSQEKSWLAGAVNNPDYISSQLFLQTVNSNVKAGRFKVKNVSAL